MLRLPTLLLLIWLCSCEVSSPATQAGESTAATSTEEALTTSNRYAGMVKIPAGPLNMGGDNEQADPNEFPKHRVEIAAFWLDEKEVTNQQFAQFVAATDYVTVAERPIDWEVMAKDLPPGTPKPPDSILQPGALVFTVPQGQVNLNNPGSWWTWTRGANWRQPEGLGSSIEEKMDHPVVQVAWEDAQAYAQWAGKRLPTEAEWEWAARGGKENVLYPWGNDELSLTVPQANFWQGPFPYVDELRDGFSTTAPVGQFPANGYGLHDMAGNVWEWCADWFDVNYYRQADAQRNNTTGPDQAFNPAMGLVPERVVRGGSFLCSENYCSGYRNSRRMGSSPDTGLNHTGFRCAAD
ncbi:MAG: formylglycine-generating enzyme family protein [Bacteroidota bacterium]